jgi:ferric-dicitrate binding protein FerR (iron transport regulator)
MKPDSDLIKKFLKNQCTDAEAEAVEVYFKEHPDELDQYIPLDDWLADSKMHVDLTVSERILQRIRKTYKTSNAPYRTKPFVRYAVAASFIGILTFAGLKWLTERDRQPTQGTTAVTPVTVSTQKLETIENNTGQVMQERLSDHSLVTVYPNSSLQYLSVFEGNKRDLYLKGKAKFKVSKDPSKPFTVYAAGISTTALGTEFLITVKDNQQVSVALMEGSVKVASQHKADSNEFVVLRPGDKLVVSSGQFLHYSLMHTADRKPTNSLTKSAEKDKPVPEENNLVFKNEPLKDVLKRVEEKFGVTINYEQAPGLEEKLFTGTFLETDDLEFIIKMISHLHGLKYSIEEKQVTISMQ